MKINHNQRIFTYILLIGFLPFILIGWRHFNNIYKLNDMSTEIHSVENKLHLHNIKNLNNTLVIKKHRFSQEFYVDKTLENIPLLRKELEILKNNEKEISFADQQTIESRTKFIKNNQLRFAETSVQNKSILKETVESLKSQVEVDEDDLVNILTHIEGVELNNTRPPSNIPLLIISDFIIQKKQNFNGSETFNLNLKIIKREFP